MTTNRILLASKSPRRHELLVKAGFDVTVIASHAHTLRAFEGDEVQWPEESPEDYVERTALTKFGEGLAQRDALGLGSNAVVLAADTVVSLDGVVLGKPKDTHEARSFLERLSGKTHEVRTAVVVGISQEQALSTVQTSLVSFKPLTDAEIEAYIRTEEPFDKAGGYGIQGLGGLFITHLEGSFTGVMGLPIYETTALLKSFGVASAIFL